MRVRWALAAMAVAGMSGACTSADTRANAASARAHPLLGMEYPFGAAAVAYLYGPDGTFRPMTSAQYRFTYYTRAMTRDGGCDMKGRRSDRTAMIAFAQGAAQSVSPDQDCHVLLDFDGNGEPDTPGGGRPAFQEHVGRGKAGALRAAPFNQFWFDDNLLASYMAAAYGRERPFGIYRRGDYARWAILGGDVRGFRTRWYRANAPDHITFRGLYDTETGRSAAALGQWNAWLARTDARRDPVSGLYAYRRAQANYWLGFALIWVETMIGSGAYSGETQQSLVQHAVSLRARIIERQEHDATGQPIGWITDADNPASLINTETTALEVLGLGAGAHLTWEAGRLPLSTPPAGYVSRPGAVLSAIAGKSPAGMPISGPGLALPPGPVTAEFTLRAPRPRGSVATIEIYDAASRTVLASRTLNAAQMPGGGRWGRMALSADVPVSASRIEFRLRWPGNCDLDMASVRLR